jgi:hypothetical protein
VRSWRGCVDEAQALSLVLDERRARSVSDCKRLVYEVVCGVRGFPEMLAGGGESEQFAAEEDRGLALAAGGDGVLGVLTKSLRNTPSTTPNREEARCLSRSW